MTNSFNNGIRYRKTGAFYLKNEKFKLPGKNIGGASLWALAKFHERERQGHSKILTEITEILLLSSSFVIAKSLITDTCHISDGAASQ